MRDLSNLYEVIDSNLSYSYSTRQQKVKYITSDIQMKWKVLLHERLYGLKQETK